MSKNIELLEKTPVGKAILLLAIPSVLAMMVQIIYGLTDTYFISRLNNPNLVAAISMVMPFALLIQASGNIFAIGGASFISRMLGAKKREEAKRTCATAFYYSIALGIFVSCVAYFFIDPILKLLGTSEATWQPAKEYMLILVHFSAVQILQIVLAGLIRSEGATKHAMLGIFIGTGLNIVFDYIFILKLNWSVAGAAWATILGNIFGVIYYLLYFKFSKTLLTVKFSFFKPDKEMLLEILAIGFPAALNAFIMSVSHIIMNNIAITYGENVMAANGIFMRINAVAIFLMMGIAQGYQPFAGYNYGAKNFKRLKSAFFFAIGYSLAIATVMGSVFYFSGHTLIEQFLQNAEVIEKGTAMLHAFIIALFMFSIHFMISMTFQATGKALLAFILVSVRQLFFFLPLLFILNAMYGFQGFILAQPIADVTTTILAVALFTVFWQHLIKKTV